MHTPDVLLEGLPNGSDMSASYTVGGSNGSLAAWLICEVAMAMEFTHCADENLSVPH